MSNYSGSVGTINIPRFSTPHFNDVAAAASYVFPADLTKGDFTVVHGAIRWSNFAGRDEFGNVGATKRTFNLVVPEDIADILKQAGYNVRVYVKKESEDNRYRRTSVDDNQPCYFTEIVVNMNSTYPPTIFLAKDVNGRKTKKKATLDEIDNLLDVLRYSDITMVIHPYTHNRPNPSGSTIKGYLRSMTLVIDSSIEESEATRVMDEEYAEYVYVESEDDSVPF